jgi:hypothetical protein
MKNFRGVGRISPGLRPAVVLIASSVLLLAGCGKSGGSGSSTPPPPSAPSGTVVSIAVNSSGPTMSLGASEGFTAVATLSDGSTVPLGVGTWSSDTPDVLLVDSTGTVIALKNGQATISLSYQNVRGSKTVRVVPNYAGVWSGKYTVTSCVQTEGFIDTNLCAQFPVGQEKPFAFQFSQTADVLTGQTALGQLGSTTFTANIESDGSVSFTTSTFFGTSIINSEWHLFSTQAGTIGGTVTQTWQDQNTTGEMDVVGGLSPPTKIASITRRATY